MMENESDHPIIKRNKRKYMNYTENVDTKKSFFE